MPAALRTPCSRWIAAACAALISGGPDAVRVESLAKQLNVTKGGFYAHFTGRDELLTEVLDDWEQRSVDDVRELVDARGGEPAERIARAGSRTFSDELVQLDLAVRSWAMRDTTVRERLRRVDDARIEFLRTEFSKLLTDPEEIEARSILAFSYAIGRHLLATNISESAVIAAGRMITSTTP